MSTIATRRIAPDALLGMAHNVEELTVSEPWDGTTRAPRAGLSAVLSPTVTAEQVIEPQGGGDVQSAKASPHADARTAGQPEAMRQDSPLLDTRGPLAKRMHATFREAGLEAKEDRLAYASAVVGREIESSAELTDAEAHEVIRALESIAADANQGQS